MKSFTPLMLIAVLSVVGAVKGNANDDLYAKCRKITCTDKGKEQTAYRACVCSTWTNNGHRSCFDGCMKGWGAGEREDHNKSYCTATCGFLQHQGNKCDRKPENCK
ncbi:unnamed protein product [Tilletia controversa]|uniref:Extracellular membrane protein CFEM domain-containing protein n=2 Tax=Tilletia TaxID=13289 RepID=A0A8X7MN40_9BASI|nr:hypothetical protein CF328_g7823 [Tilletia controversa]KAE8185593.1 hypothetical protein CF335_g7679 [Tilletia laevis]KAE8255036.1 hypothetical protein A4X03_0g5623 [Tilletia caries]KAE8196611.1 hypothetical protein CF336_g2546 [Tilletia laevis]KAE8242697.1 hypothetical protein A4X06_0g6794 [Tilletia controversa]